MPEVQASEAKAQLLQLLDEVERGETLIITRYGRAIARIVPEVGRQQEEIDKAIASIRDLRKRTGKITVEEFKVSARSGPQTLMPFVLDASIATCCVADVSFLLDGYLLDSGGHNL